MCEGVYHKDAMPNNFPLFLGLFALAPKPSFSMPCQYPPILLPELKSCQMPCLVPPLSTQAPQMSFFCFLEAFCFAKLGQLWLLTAYIHRNNKIKIAAVIC